MTSSASRTTRGRGRLYESVVDTIGDTPCIRVNNLAPKHVRVYVKAEFFNPAGSVKDRLAISIIEEAERRGDLKPSSSRVGPRPLYHAEDARLGLDRRFRSQESGEGRGRWAA